MIYLAAFLLLAPIGVYAVVLWVRGWRDEQAQRDLAAGHANRARRTP